MIFIKLKIYLNGIFFQNILYQLDETIFTSVADFLNDLNSSYLSKLPNPPNLEYYRNIYIAQNETQIIDFTTSVLILQSSQIVLNYYSTNS